MQKCQHAPSRHATVALFALPWCLGLAPSLQAERATVLQFDPPSAFGGTVNGEPLNFDRDDPLAPEPSDFEVLAAAPMSNEVGERWALVTVRNTSVGHRILENDQLVAVFADGSRAPARNLGIRLAGGERVTQAVRFGIRKFPIIRLLTRN